MTFYRWFVASRILIMPCYQGLILYVKCWEPMKTKLTRQCDHPQVVSTMLYVCYFCTLALTPVKILVIRQFATVMLATVGITTEQWAWIVQSYLPGGACMYLLCIMHDSSCKPAKLHLIRFSHFRRATDHTMFDIRGNSPHLTLLQVWYCRLIIILITIGQSNLIKGCITSCSHTLTLSVISIYFTSLVKWFIHLRPIYSSHGAWHCLPLDYWPLVTPHGGRCTHPM